MSNDLRITVDELRKQMEAGDKITFLDTRNPQAWGQSDVVLPGAIRVPLDKFEEHLGEIPRNKPVVAYCT